MSPLHHRAILESFTRLARSLSDVVVGVYVGGSALRDDFSATASDLDVTVLCDRRVPLQLEHQLLVAAREYTRVSSSPLDVRVLSRRALTPLQRHQLARHSLCLWGLRVRPPREAPDSAALLEPMRGVARWALERSVREPPGRLSDRLWGKGTLRLLYLDRLRRDCAGLAPRQLHAALIASRAPRSVKQKARAALAAIEGAA